MTQRFDHGSIRVLKSVRLYKDIDFSHCLRGETMLIAKQMDIRSNIKDYFDKAYSGEIILVPRKGNKNVVILSEEEYNRMNSESRLSAYANMLSLQARGIKPPVIPSSGDIRVDNLNKLELIRGLKDNWNGNGAAALPGKLLDRVGELINELMIQPEIFPTALGTIQFEYDNSRHDHMEIEIGDSGIAEVFIVPYIGDERFESVSVSANAINQRVGEFYG